MGNLYNLKSFVKEIIGKMVEYLEEAGEGFEDLPRTKKECGSILKTLKEQDYLPKGLSLPSSRALYEGIKEEWENYQREIDLDESFSTWEEWLGEWVREVKMLVTARIVAKSRHVIPSFKELLHVQLLGVKYEGSSGHFEVTRVKDKDV